MKVIAHRGNDGIHKENSLEAIINSIESEYTDGVEFDIRFTRDFKFAITHDLISCGYCVRKTKIKNLQRQGLNELEEVLRKIKNNKIILIEVKEESKRYKFLAFRLANILYKYNLNYYICSFNYDFLKYFKKKYPIYKVGLLVGVKANLKNINNELDFNSVYYKHLNKNSKKEVFAWTVNDPKEAKRLNVNIITDNAKEIYEIKKNF